MPSVTFLVSSVRSWLQDLDSRSRFHDVYTPDVRKFSCKLGAQPEFLATCPAHFSHLFLLLSPFVSLPKLACVYPAAVTHVFQFLMRLCPSYLVFWRFFSGIVLVFLFELGIIDLFPVCCRFRPRLWFTTLGNVLIKNYVQFLLTALWFNNVSAAQNEREDAGFASRMTNESGNQIVFLDSLSKATSPVSFFWGLFQRLLENRAIAAGQFWPIDRYELSIIKYQIKYQYTPLWVIICLRNDK